jgi:hypothetical protein
MPGVSALKSIGAVGRARDAAAGDKRVLKITTTSIYQEVVRKLAGCFTRVRIRDLGSSFIIVSRRDRE